MNNCQNCGKPTKSHRTQDGHYCHHCVIADEEQKQTGGKTEAWVAIKEYLDWMRNGNNIKIAEEEGDRLVDQNINVGNALSVYNINTTLTVRNLSQESVAGHNFYCEAKRWGLVSVEGDNEA